MTDQTASKPLKLQDIARRIQEHLKRIEDAVPRDDPRRFFFPTSRAAGSKVCVKYVSYQYEHKLTKADALEYLAWLDAGNIGKHTTPLGFNYRIREGASHD